MKKLYGTFMSVVAGLAVLGALAACSSTEPKATADVAAPQSQQAYVDYAKDQVAYWRNRSKAVPAPDRSRVQAAVRDAEVTLDQLKRADDATWRTYRTRMEDSLANIERMNRRAFLER